MALLRALLLAVVAMAVAIAPAAPCTMKRHAVAGRAAAPADPHDHHRPLAAPDGTRLAPSAAVHHAGVGGGPDCHRHAAAGQHQPGLHGRHKRLAGCAATCCPLACQAAMPDAPWSGDTLILRASEPPGLAQQDAVAEPRPVRIERPPRHSA